MDIRNFFKKPKLDDSLNGPLDKTKSMTIETNSTSTVAITNLSKGGSFNDQVENVEDKEVAYYKNDIGHYLENVKIDDALKFDILCNPPFRHIWLEENNTCLSYSTIGGVKGAFCRNVYYLSQMFTELIKNDIVNLANAANAFSVIADETADISGTEQFSIGIRFLDKHLNLPKILEEFLGFTPLDKLNAQTDMMVVLQWLDKKAVLNLVINNLNEMTIIRNTTGTIKDIIRFFREKPVTNMLQGVSVDLYKVSEHINSLRILFDNHRNDADNIFQTLYNEAKSIAIDLDIVITRPRTARTVKKQSLRANYETESCEDYYRSLPATSCTAERSFTTLRRVKTWLRSTMGDDRLKRICMLSVHREKVNSNKEKFIETALTQFGRECPRRLKFIFNEKE
ncbi:52 kDa repressor of the inhibitor of the protein kinase-like [Aphis craccivora]|uniref:52 kDa repressor of the inhibitor of the protein kinase-like n=1 Tax=Aphis craccivora TaxID=307492 RepID=A0A6G0YAA0_APHCR|nr:52 kDa repressor of the inhibitor of the protein kinase-like [Aphis craccivora]